MNKKNNTVSSESDGGQFGHLWLSDILISLPLPGCEVAPDVNVAAQKFLIRLLVPAPEGMNEVYLRCDDVRPHTPPSSISCPSSASSDSLSRFLSPLGLLQEQQYARWMAACRLGSKGKTLADDSFQSEIQTIRSFLAMQRSSSNSHSNVPDNDESINTHSLVSPRYHKKYKTKQVLVKITSRIMFQTCDAAQFLFIDHLLLLMCLDTPLQLSLHGCAH